MNYYENIKNNLLDVEIQNKVKDYSKNKYTLEKYYDVGRLLFEAQGGEERAHYGDGLIKEYSKKLVNELGEKYNERTLRRMRQFYITFKNINWSPLATNLTWSHFVELLSLKDTDKINYYINKCITYNLSRNKLRELIKLNEYERLPESTKNKLIIKEKTNIEDLVKNPIVIKNTFNKEIISEKILQQLILENLESFLKELGNGFTFIGSEYPIKIGDRYNYIDLLLYNYIYNCFVVVELKITELKKEYIGQIQVYMNYINENIKTINQNNTIGIIIAKEDNKYLIKYASDDRIFTTKYITI